MGSRRVIPKGQNGLASNIWRRSWINFSGHFLLSLSGTYIKQSKTIQFNVSNTCSREKQGEANRVIWRTRDSSHSEKNGHENNMMADSKTSTLKIPELGGYFWSAYKQQQHRAYSKNPSWLRILNPSGTEGIPKQEVETLSSVTGFIILLAMLPSQSLWALVSSHVK